MRFCCWECGWCWCWRERDADFSVKPGVGVGRGNEHDDETQTHWAKKFLGFRNTLKNWFEFDRQTDLGDDDLMFSLLLALYSADLISRDSIEGIEEEALIADEMKAIYARDPSVVEFYLPQLCTYLASNGFDSDVSPRVMLFLLEDICRRDLRLAHRVMWHINAFFSPSTHHDAQLMKKCVEREGAISARAIQPKLGVDPFNSHASSMSQLIRLESNENIISHLGADDYKNSETVGHQELFYSCMNFVEALTKLSAKLTEIDPSNREEYVHDALDRINKVFLCRESAGSELVYIPMGRCYFRVIRIIPSESLLLTTKERVPLFLTLEVESFELNQLGIGNFGQELKDRGFNQQFDAFRRKLIDGFTALREKALSGHGKDESSIPRPSTPGVTYGHSTHSQSHLIPPLSESNHLGQWTNPLPKIPAGEESEILGRLGEKKRCLSDSEDFYPLVCEDPNSIENDGLASTSRSKISFVQAQEPGTRRDNKNGKTKGSPLLMTPDTHEDDQDGRGGIYSHHPKTSPSKFFFNEIGDVVDEDEEYEVKLDEMVSSGTAKTGGNDQELIIFKEGWREKEARIWQQGVLDDSDEVRSPSKQLRTRTRKDSDIALLHTGDVGEGDTDQVCDDEREVRRYGDSGGSWSLVPIIVKANDDLRQEQAVSQLIAILARIWRAEKIGVWVHSYSIMAISPTAGIIEAIPDTLSLHALKSHTRGIPLDRFFKCYFLKKKGGLRRARSNFVKSCAGYAIVCYLLQIKDRHNGNILIDAEGHLVHIDWGFVLGLSPGGNFGFENAPFKLTTEMVSIMGGIHSFAYQNFRILCVRAFLEARRQREKLILLVEMLAVNRDLPCFSRCDPRTVVEGLRDRFLPDKTPSECADIIYEMIATSKASWRTSIYDWFQKYASGVL